MLRKCCGSVFSFLLLFAFTLSTQAQLDPIRVEVSAETGEPVQIPLVYPGNPPVDESLDMVFVLDNAGGMASHIARVKQGITDLVLDMATTWTEQPRLALVTFNDEFAGLNRADIRQEFTDSFPLLLTAVNATVAFAGGDCPDYAITGLRTAINELDWREDSMRWFRRFMHWTFRYTPTPRKIVAV